MPSSSVIIIIISLIACVLMVAVYCTGILDGEFRGYLENSDKAIAAGKELMLNEFIGFYNDLKLYQNADLMSTRQVNEAMRNFILKKQDELYGSEVEPAYVLLEEEEVE